jgi:hypothetical protein
MREFRNNPANEGRRFIRKAGGPEGVLCGRLRLPFD